MRKLKQVTILEKRFSYFPHRFMIEDKEHNVKSIVRTQSNVSKNAQLLFQVKTEEGQQFELIQSVRTDTWVYREL